MKKICIISNSSYNLINFRKELIISLISEGYYVCTITPDNNYSFELSNLGCVNYILNYGSQFVLYKFYSKDENLEKYEKMFDDNKGGIIPLAYTIDYLKKNKNTYQ